MTVTAGFAVAVAGAVDKCPALFDKPGEVQRSVKAAVQQIISAPWIAGSDELLLAVAGAVIISGYHWLILVEGHFAVGVHSDDTVCDVKSSVYACKA